MSEKNISPYGTNIESTVGRSAGTNPAPNETKEPKDILTVRGDVLEKVFPSSPLLSKLDIFWFFGLIGYCVESQSCKIALDIT